MERDNSSRSCHQSAMKWLVLAFGAVLALPLASLAQLPGTENAQWTYLGGDAGHTRYTPADQINASNFGNLEVAWQFNAASFGPSTPRATPSYVDGRLITVTGERRTMIALNPGTGELLWSFTEPNTGRYEYSMRYSYGKGIAYGERNGRGVAYISTPGFFLHALDVVTGEPLANWGEAVPIDGFPPTGSQDMLADIIDGWGPWENGGRPFDPSDGIPLELGYITSSSPPIVVNGVVVVGNSAEQGYLQTRMENIPGDILAYDEQTGALKWKFHIIPRPGEYGHDTWENDAWEWTGDVSSWAPMSADPELGLVYVVTNGVTIDYYGGFSPGDNLYSTSIIALDAQTGERVWHYQMVHHDIWNYDTPTAPILMDVNVDGREIKGLFQATKQNFLYALDRETGEPIWPIEERAVPASTVPGEQLAATQPFPTRPAPYDLQGRDESMLIDYTPEIYEMALKVAQDGNLFNSLFDPPRTIDDPLGPTWNCPGGGGGVNITGPPVADPVEGVMYITSTGNCFRLQVEPGITSNMDSDQQSGKSHSDWVAVATSVPGGAIPTLDGTRQGVPIWKGPAGRITAIDMNTGDHLWAIPHGDASQAEQDRIRNNPVLQGVDGVMVNRGRGGHSTMVASPTLLFATGQTADGAWKLFAIDKQTGERVGAVDIPGSSRYGMSSWMHEGKQYIIVQLNDGLAAMALP